jgi:uncharacterized membrane protein
MSWLATVLATFTASAVEVVEAVTIILAVGITRGWRSTLIGVSAAAVVLAGLAAVLGTALTKWVPLNDLKIAVGGLLLVFGLQWLRKAVLRSSGYKALHNEDEAFLEEREEARTAPRVERASLDWFAFTVAFKGVLLEGLEVVFIVITIGAASGRLAISAASAGAAAVIVGGAGFALRHPLSRVPENSLKFAVGLLLTTFGTFWAAEGVGVRWWGNDGGLLYLLGLYAVASVGAVSYLREARRRPYPGDDKLSPA